MESRRRAHLPPVPPRSAATLQRPSSTDDSLHLLNLPDADGILTSHIFPFLGPKFALVGLGSTCDRFRRLATNDGLWRTFWSMRAESELARLARGVALSLPGLTELDGGRDHIGGIFREADSWQSGPPDNANEEGGGRVMNAYRDKLLSTSYPKPTCQVVDANGNLIHDEDAPCDFVLSRVEGARAHRIEPATVWCCWPDCQRARCREKCPAAAAATAPPPPWPGRSVDPGTRSDPDPRPWVEDPKFYACGWCRVTLCGGCAHPSVYDARPLNEPRQTMVEDYNRIAARVQNCRSEPTKSDDLVRQCNVCRRGACLDCEKIVWLGQTRRCSSKSSFHDGYPHEEKCELDLCWRCSWKFQGDEGDAKDPKGPIRFSSLEEFREAGEIFCESCCRGKWKWMLERLDQKTKRVVDAEPKAGAKKARFSAVV